jgi:hypothetical protein
MSGKTQELFVGQERSAMFHCTDIPTGRRYNGTLPHPRNVPAIDKG